MQKYGVIANGQALPNVTVTTFSSDDDRAEARGICAKKQLDEKKSGQVLNQVTFKNFRHRMAKGGAEEVRYFPLPNDA